MSFLGKRMLESAREKKFAIGGFDVFNMESAQAVVKVAEELSMPVFLQVCIPSAQFMGLEMAFKILSEAKKNSSVDICIHLDHGPEAADADFIKKAIEAGFESIMADGSSLSLEDNIAFTRKVVEMAHPRGICVEGELGKVSRNTRATQEEIARLMTDPEEAAHFVEKTAVDYLAVSVGSISGMLKGKTNLDLERLQRIRENVTVPLVFHGGTGIADDQLKKAIKIGVSKINIAHGFRKAFLDGMRAYLRSNPEEIDPRKVLREASKSCEEYLREKIKLLCCDNF